MIASVTVRRIPERCSRCRARVGLFNFRVVVDDDLVTRAFDAACEGRSTAFRTLPWACSTCSADLARCRFCGHRVAGIPCPWFIDDDGLITCHPFAPVPGGRISCFNESCAAYCGPAFGEFLARRDRAVTSGSFPDPWGLP